MGWFTFYRLASGMLAAVEKLHLRGLVHRDVKPTNFCLGLDNKYSPVYLVDFGFVQDLPQKGDDMEDYFCGTPDFASSNALKGLRCGPRDDCESLAYSFLQLWNNGHIPWNITHRPKKRSSNRDSKGQKLRVENTESHWDADCLSKMLARRGQCFERRVREGAIPKFVHSWLLYLTTIQPWELPDYSLLKVILSNSHAHWVDHAFRKPLEEYQDGCQTCVQQRSSLPAMPCSLAKEIPT